MNDVKRRRLRAWLARVVAWAEENELRLTIVGLLLLLVFAFFWSNIVISVRAGQAGVLWSRLSGTQTDRIYPEGTHLILPWNVMTVYDVRYQKVDRSFLVLSRDGLEITVEATIRFKPVDKLVPKLHQQVGPGYVDTVVAPEVHTAVRTVIGRFRPDELYAASFEEIQADVVSLARRQVRNRFVLVDDVLIRTIVLPNTVAAAIQRKLEQEQLALEMQYRLARERQEAERKVIEAGGIHDFQQLVATTLTPQLLQFKGIEATLELARSNNAKIVVIGSGKDGLPLILNADGVAPAAPPPVAAVAPLPSSGAERTAAVTAPAAARKAQADLKAAVPPKRPP